MDNCRTVNLAHQLRPNASQAHQSLTPLVTAAAVTALTGYALHANTSYVRVQCLGGTVRATFDGSTAPSASVGFLFADGSERLMTREEWILCRVIIGASTPTLQVQGLKL